MTRWTVSVRPKKGNAMNEKKIMKLFRETAYVRMGGSPEEKQAAAWLVQQCEAMGVTARLEEFPVDMATIHNVSLEVDGKMIPCKGYLNAGSHQVEAPLYYLTDNCPHSL